MFNSVSSRTPGSFLGKLLPSWSTTSMYRCMHFCPLDFTLFLTTVPTFVPSSPPTPQLLLPLRSLSASLLSAPILSPQCLLSAVALQLPFYFKIADNSSFLPPPWTQITLQHPFVIDSTSFPDFAHRKNKSWLHAAAIKNLLECVQMKEKEQLSGGKKNDV